MKKLMLFLPIILLAGCAGAPLNGPIGFIANKDLAGAESMAKTAGDTQGATCWAALSKAMSPGIVGAFGLVEQTRILKMAQQPCAGVVIVP